MPDYYINGWNQAGGSWMQYSGNFPCVPSAMETLDVLEAWSINYANDWNCPGGTGMDIEFMGPIVNLHTGAYSAPFGYGAAGYEAWTMFGNPYPSGIDMNAIAWDPGMVQGAAFYDGCAGNYVYWTPAVGSYSMSPGAGFFTEATAPGTFALTGAERAHGADWFYKSEVTNLLTIQVSGNDKSDITHIRFMENASAGFENTGDFHKLFSTEIPQIYTRAGEDLLAINVLPATEMVPMSITSTASGSFTIEAIETSEFANVVLEDIVTGEFTNLLTGSYTFDYVAGTNADRFIVHFTPLGSVELEANSINIYSVNNLIYVNVPAGVQGEIALYNVMGQELTRTGIESGLNTLSVNDVNAYYIVKVLTNNNVVTEKVYIK
jgi:hypothetical protein